MKNTALRICLYSIVAGGTTLYSELRSMDSDHLSRFKLFCAGVATVVSVCNAWIAYMDQHESNKDKIIDPQQP